MGEGKVAFANEQNAVVGREGDDGIRLVRLILPLL